MEDIKVSVICITYNQAEYIKDAINSFLMQKTNFSYEIIIHDDASTDGTIEVLKYYEKKYPSKVRIVYEEENQYSKGVNISDVLFKIAKGKYFAFCEGDDFWTDQYKLQKQFDYMEQHNDCMAYIHSGWKIKKDKSVIYNSHPISNVCTKYYMEDAIKGLGIKAYTNSFFMRATVFESRPGFLAYAPTRDYVMMVEFEYSEVIEKEKTNQMFSNILARKDKAELSKEPYKTMLKQMTLKRKLQAFHPIVFNLLSKGSRIIRNEKKNFVNKVHYEEF